MRVKAFNSIQLIWLQEDKAEYTATQVAWGRAGAVLEVTLSFEQAIDRKNPKKKVWRVDRLTEGPTDRLSGVSSRVARG